MPSASALDAITVDAFGTVLRLVDPVPSLVRSLASSGVRREPSHVRAAFLAEAAYYRPRSLHGRDAATLEALRTECAAVFLDELDAPLDPAGFVPAFLAAISFRLEDGAREALADLRGSGLALACVANWDVGLRRELARAGIERAFDVVLSSAEAGAAKPDPAIFAHALAALGVSPARALHVGDEETDRAGAAAAGLGFEPVPLSTVPARLGISLRLP